MCKGAVHFTDWWGSTLAHGRCLHFPNHTSSCDAERGGGGGGRESEREA